MKQQHSSNKMGKRKSNALIDSDDSRSSDSDSGSGSDIDKVIKLDIPAYVKS